MRVLWLMIISVFTAAVSAAPAEIPDFKKEVRPILEKRCFECHNPEKHKGDLNLAPFETLEQVKAAPETWASALERVQSFEMPPKGKGELSFDELGKLTRFF